MLVIDDTEHFASAQDGEIDAESIHNLYHHAVRALAEMQQLDLVIAVHPRFEEVEVLGEVTSRFGFSRVEVPSLPARSDDSGLAVILQRRLARSEIDARVADLIDADALAQLEGLDFFIDHDLRVVLDLAADAAQAAVADGDHRIGRRHVQPLLDARSR